MTKAEYLKLRGWTQWLYEPKWEHPNYIGTKTEDAAFTVQAERDFPAFMAAEARIAHLEEELARLTLAANDRAKWSDERIAKLEAALRGLLESMAMQEGRETGEFHIPRDVAWEIWKESVAAGLRALEEK